MNTSTNYKTIHKIVYWIAASWFSSVPNSISHGATWINQVETWERENGPIWTIKHIKMMRQLVFSHLSGNPQMKVNQIIGINRSNGLPKSINYLHSLIESKDKTNIRYVLTLLSISRAIPGWVNPNFKTITDWPKSDPDFDVNPLIKYMSTFKQMYKLEVKLPLYFDRKDFILSQKAGPNGSATRTALFDLISMPATLRKILGETNIGPIITEYQNLLTPNRIKRYHVVQKNWEKWKKLMKTGKVSMNFFDPLVSKEPIGIMRKLSIVKDPEAKSRIIAIFDFWSQTWLRQIHSIHFKILALLPTDRTFTQDPIIHGKPEGHKFYSFDLTAATDRFPISLQKELMVTLFGDEVASQWEKILINYPFQLPKDVPLHTYTIPGEEKSSTSNEIYYCAGQPMGAYSSWSCFTLTHHVILHFIHHELGLSKHFYQILGDDIVIYHDDVAEHYQRIMKGLGVEISIPKSNISSNMYEFAKRVFISGNEVTGIQIRGLLENYTKYHLLYQALYDLIYTRGYYPKDLVSIPDLIFHLMIIIGMKTKQALNIKSRVASLHAFNKFLHGDITPFIENIKARYPHYEGQLQFPEIELNNWVYMAMDETLRKVNAEYINYAKDLITRPSLIEQAAIGLADPTDIWTSPIYYLTKLPIMEALSNTIGSLNRARKLDSIRDIVKAIALPDTSVFEKRGATRVIGAYAKLAKSTISKIEHYVIQGRLAPMPDPNLGTQVLDRIRQDIKNYQIDKSFGLIPPSPAPKAPEPKIDPYAPGLQMW